MLFQRTTVRRPGARSHRVVLSVCHRAVKATRTCVVYLDVLDVFVAKMTSQDLLYLFAFSRVCFNQKMRVAVASDRQPARLIELTCLR
jgi:hypothetical protein